MDFITQAYAQLVELLRSMSPGTRLATALLLVVVVVSVAYLFQYNVAGGDEFLLGGRPFSASELTAIEAAFAKAGLGKSQIVGSTIRIPRGKKELYLAALADGNALPADFYKYLDDAVNKDSPWASKQSLDMRRWNAKQKEISLIIGKMKGIESATVQYDEETKRGLVQTKQKTAMVAVKTASGQLEDHEVKAIRNVVASAYAGLDRHNITITDLDGTTYGGAISENGTTDDESIYAAHKSRFERDFQRKLRDQLSYIPGIIVGINVELTPEVKRESMLEKIDQKPTTVSTKTISKEMTSHAPQIQGRPGAQSNGVGNQPVALQQSATSGGESTSTESREDILNVPGHETTQTTFAGLVPKKVTASIDVPASYFIAVWKRRNPQQPDKPAKEPEAAELATIATEEKDFIKEKVRNLLPDVDKGTNPYPHIVVSTYTDLPATLPAAPSLAATAGTWLADNWQTLALVGVGLVSLVMLRSMVRSPAVATPSPAAASEKPATPRLAVHDPAGDEEEPEPMKVLKTRFRATGPDLKAELKEIVKENPDAAATILRSWIGEAA
jgi:flagellar M-ring protein FliF